ncbi:penicillin-binding protein 2 [Nonomuraea fastidiosa]|jgi:penicillin-binding protein 2|uniref:penicillin-binding protein 2 n=1 Tax=Nonomuraea fastidiosa TaxID=46173 RepID=UPI00366C722E
MRHSRFRLPLVHLLVAVLFITLLGRLWQVQIVDGERYTRAAVADHVRRIAIPPVRGRILDDRGRPLARNRAEMTVSVDRVALRRQPDGGRATLRALAELLDRPYKELARRIRLCGPKVGKPCWAGSPYQPIPVAEGVAERKAMQIVERPERFPGVSAAPAPVRDHPRGELAAHVLGYLSPGEGKGADGLEAAYEADLKGRPGSREVVVDSAGQVLRTVREQPPVPGSTLVTSIDADVQRVVERALSKAVRGARGADSGAAVVMEARTGRIVAMASAPGYDPRVWTGGIDQADYRKLTRDDRLLSRAVQGQWPPASTWKIVSTAAAAASGYPLDGRYDCPGSYQVGDRAFRNAGGADLGTMNLHRALVVSCDTIYYRFAEQLWGKGDDEAMQRMARAFGFGAKTGVDLPGEAAGRVPDRAWKKAFWEATRDETCEAARKGYPEVAKKDPRRAAYLKAVAAENCAGGYAWSAGDAANFSIGQGDVLVTPLQLARAYAALANGGTLFSPRVGKEVRGPDGALVRKITPPVAGRLPVPAKTLRYLRDALAEVPRSGTAAQAFDGFPFGRLAVAGKTGTAEAYGTTDTSWFASFAPAKKPKYVVVAVVSKGGAGGEAAAPAVREIWSGMYGLEGRKAALPERSRR